MISELSRNGRASYQPLSHAVGLAPNTVAERMRRHREGGVITDSTVVIDERALGLELGVLSDIKLHEAVSRVDFAESLTKVPQVVGALRLTGEYDYQLHIVCSGASVNSRLILREVPVDKAKLLDIVP
ncbi:AsnC family transcriptional regulator [Kocuria sp. ZOR0020]|uniref:Lrp/AsnC family transcriptional regulator n=1 Tax=Kocuria sp. ZOR0020 TaxID=1339234 RepID=UPI0009DE11C6